MKIVIINKSDTIGGAAVVSRRLLNALRSIGEDARLLVAEKLSDSPYVIKAAPDYVVKWKFLLERLKIFFANGFNRKTLFKIDTGEEGLPLWKHPYVREADIILIQWINQGFLSLKGFKKILKSGKRVILTMHDMWPMTGICHHAGGCNRFHENCGDCPFLGNKKSANDISFKIWKKKNTILSNKNLSVNLYLVSVSEWLKKRAEASSLLRKKKIEVIGNPYKKYDNTDKKRVKNKIRILFGAARLDDPIKGLDILKKTALILKEFYPEESEKPEFIFFGDIKNPKILADFPLPAFRTGLIKEEEKVAHLYLECDIVVSASSYETFGYTLLEGQAYGVIPVSFSQGGQTDIIRHKETGYLASYDKDPDKAAENLAEGLRWAVDICKNPDKHQEMKKKLIENAERNFSYDVIARKYMSILTGIVN